MIPAEFARDFVPMHLKDQFRKAFLKWSTEPSVAFQTAFYSKDVLVMLLNQVESDEEC